MKSDKLYECIKYCEEQNGMPVCKNCGLDEDIITEALEEEKNIIKQGVRWALQHEFNGYAGKLGFTEIELERIINESPYMK